jgi:hypothetical protein
LACYLHFRLSFLAKRRAWFTRYLPICSPLISAISKTSNYKRVHHFRRWDDLSYFNPTIVGRTALHRTGSIFTFVFHLSFFPYPYHEPKVFQRLSIVCLFLGEEGKKKKGVLNFVLLDSIILEIPLLLGRIAYIQYIQTYICVLLLAL